MKIKPGVRFLGVKPEILIALMVADSVYSELGYDMTVTSCVDGEHSYKSKHYSGYAVDLRTRDVSPVDQQLIISRLKDRLTADFDAVLESNHIHIEFDPKESL